MINNVGADVSCAVIAATCSYDAQSERVCLPHQLTSYFCGDVSPAIVELLRGDTRSERTLMLDAEGRVAEASAILQMNGGQLRTEYLHSA